MAAILHSTKLNALRGIPYNRLVPDPPGCPRGETFNVKIIETQSASAAVQAIANALSGAMDCAWERSRLLRIEARIPDTPPLDWLRAQAGFTRYFWSDRAGEFEMAGVGEADVLVPSEKTDIEALFRHIREELSPVFPSMRYYGGFRFHGGAVKGERWRAFKEYRFVVPRFEVLRRERGGVLACNFRVAGDTANLRTRDAILADLVRLRFPETPPPVALAKAIRRTDRPDRTEWTRLVARALGAIDQGELEKVVLARETCFTAAEPLDPVSLLSLLRHRTVKSYEFCFHPAGDRAFIGASPECLYKRRNVYLRSEALAGTQPRGATDALDRAYGAELLRCEKNRREHAFVVETLRGHFADFCRHVQADDSPRLLRLRNCQHLLTRIEGILTDPLCDAELITALHPTPAVGGVPRDRAQLWIAREEPFDRGIYAAPVGWAGYDAAEFCVAIRSGLVRDNELALYSGAGIVRGSTPKEEWDEIENKMANFVSVMNHAR